MTMRTSRRFIVLVLMTLFCGLMAVGCDDLVADPNFHTWCGDQLCSWKLESGQIRKAPTWHRKDYGVELMDSTDATRVTALSQETDNSPRCLEFTTIADVTPEAQVFIGLDFNRDGTVDYEQPIAATGFREQKTQVTAPLRYYGIRFVITKKGTGRAVLAQMQVKGVSGCTAAPFVPKPQPLGLACSLGNNGDECSSGICCDGLCSECCEASSIGEKLPDGGTAHNEAAACAAGGECKMRVQGVRGFLQYSVPRQCDPGKGKHTAGSECLVGDDCASGVCEGAEWKAATKSTSTTPGADCPVPAAYTDESCNVSFVRGGRCR
jgi:hypothetical protein